MCGFSGIISFKDTRPIDEGRLVAMTDAIHHRGPDDEGFLIDGHIGLGHKRLSIIDIGVAGRQPMSTPDQRYWIVYNGEIYNFLELRDELSQCGYDFRTKTDTEVLLRLYERDGAGCVERLRGMYAFAIYDREAGDVFLARDPFGIKPLYYANDTKEFLFASEAKAIHSARGNQTSLNRFALAEYFRFQFTLGDTTFFDGIRKLLPGQCVTVARSGAVTLRQFDVAKTAKQQIGLKEAAERLENILVESVHLHVRSDVPIGAHLSGGIDTTSIVALARREIPTPFKTFTGAFRAGGIYDDSARASELAAHFGTDHHTIYPQPDDVAAALPRIIWHLDEPVGAPGSIAQYFVSKLAADHVKVVLGGQGADEFLGGYTRYYLFALDGALKGTLRGEPRPPGLISLLRSIGQLKGYGPMMAGFWPTGFNQPAALRYLSLISRESDEEGLLSPDFSKGLDPNFAIQNYINLFDRDPGSHPIDRMLNFESQIWLPALLHLEDRTSMAWSIESRVPGVDRAVADFARSLSPDVLMSDGRLKIVLRKAMRNYVPSTTLDRSLKIGFPVPLAQWFSGPLKDWIADLMLGEKTLQRGIFRETTIRGLVKSRSQFSRRLWAALSVELWCRNFIDGNGNELTYVRKAPPQFVFRHLK
jgi:asparagine synthase (glutamine-hydrolysing)